MHSTTKSRFGNASLSAARIVFSASNTPLLPCNPLPFGAAPLTDWHGKPAVSKSGANAMSLFKPSSDAQYHTSWGSACTELGALACATLRAASSNSTSSTCALTPNLSSMKGTDPNPENKSTTLRYLLHLIFCNSTPCTTFSCSPSDKTNLRFVGSTPPSNTPLEPLLSTKNALKPHLSTPCLSTFLLATSTIVGDSRHQGKATECTALSLRNRCQFAFSQSGTTTVPRTPCSQNCCTALSISGSGGHTQ